MEKGLADRIDAGSEKCMVEVSTLAAQVKELKRLVEDAAVKVDKYEQPPERYH
jgi:hypothetical protein